VRIGHTPWAAGVIAIPPCLLVLLPPPGICRALLEEEATPHVECKLNAIYAKMGG
jgi:hypothetical protein